MTSFAQMCSCLILNIYGKLILYNISLKKPNVWRETISDPIKDSILNPHVKIKKNKKKLVCESKVRFVDRVRSLRAEPWRAVNQTPQMAHLQSWARRSSRPPRAGGCGGTRCRATGPASRTCCTPSISGRSRRGTRGTLGKTSSHNRRM